MKYKIDDVKKIGDKLKMLPKIEVVPTEVNRQDAVKLLLPEIAVMQARGYTLNQIAEHLTGNGIEISGSTLRSYIQRAKGSKVPAKKRKQEKPDHA